MLQKCPICDGAGEIDLISFDGTTYTNTFEICSTCNGTRMVDQVTGLPPKMQETLASDKILPKANSDEATKEEMSQALSSITKHNCTHPMTFIWNDNQEYCSVCLRPASVFKTNSGGKETE